MMNALRVAEFRRLNALLPWLGGAYGLDIFAAAVRDEPATERALGGAATGA